MRVKFTDTVEFNKTEKTALSVRDGVLEYYGLEIGMEPADKIFKVYRSPATIANVAPKMIGLPITNDHVSTDEPVKDSVGTIQNAIMVDAFLPSVNSTLAIKNKIALQDNYVPLVEVKKEMSLGYHGDLVPHDTYDFEQVDIEPHHLAIVDKGRNGSICSFIDKQKEGSKNMKKRFHDDDGSFNLQEFVEVIQALPEAAKRVPVDKLKEIMPQLREIVTYTEAATGEQVVESTDEDKAKLEEERKALDSDKEKFEKEKGNFSDSAAFKDAIAKRVKIELKDSLTVIAKARQFLPATYDFTDKTATKIMRDTLEAEGQKDFADSELSIAFKMLKPQSKHMNFGDKGNVAKFTDLENKEY